MLALVWGIAITGIIIKGFWVFCPKWVSSVLYISMGWICVLAFSQILNNLTRAEFGWLLAGGIIYTIGGVIYALKLPIFNIRDEFFTRAEKTIEKLHEKTDCKINLYDFSDPEVLKKEIAESAILVNGTSIGMAPKTDRCIITDDSVFRKDLFVFDVIYNPEETLFLKKAKAAGCRTLNGLNMLLYQGAASFELWTGKEMPVDIIKEKYFSR